MPKNDEMFTITVKILGSEMKIPVKRADEQYVREAAKVMETLYEKITRQALPTTHNFKIETYWKLVALELGAKLKKLEEEKKELGRQISQLEKDIDQIIR